jgi:RNA ligase
MFTSNQIRQAVNDGFITVRKHPKFDLFVYNYTKQTQYDSNWNKLTINCRGLILDAQANLIARPMSKFFNLDEITKYRNHVHDWYGLKFSTMFDSPYKIWDKMDGSLGILYKFDGQYGIASRGSFDSEMAHRATKILHEKYSHVKFDDEYTYLFEIIYPENRIVINYNCMEDIVLLAKIHKETGREANILDETDFIHPKLYDNHDLDSLAMLAEENKEGFVIHFDNGLRVKYKFDEYKRLHKIMTGVTERDIWWRLRNKESLSDLIDKVPDEYYDWIRAVESKLKGKYGAIKNHVMEIYTKMVKDSRPIIKKDVALKYKDYEYKSILFAIIDGKEYEETIWRMVRPEANKKYELKDEE